MAPDTVRHCIQSADVNLCGLTLGIRELELVLMVLRERGEVNIRGCGGVMSLMELGAYLNSLTK